MSNALILGTQCSGNTLVLRASPLSAGKSYGVSDAYAIPMYNGYAPGAAAPVATGFALALADGTVLGAAEPIAQGLTTRGDGYSYGSATVAANNALVFGYSYGTSTVGGAGASHSEFAPYFMWPGYSSDGLSITIPLADLDAILDATEADPTEGDWRKIMQSFLLAADAHYATLTAVVGGTPKTYRSHIVVNYDARHPVLGKTLRRTALSHFFINHETGDVAVEP